MWRKMVVCSSPLSNNFFSPEYPSGGEQGSFFGFSHQSILWEENRGISSDFLTRVSFRRGTGKFLQILSPEYLFGGERGNFLYFLTRVSFFSLLRGFEKSSDPELSNQSILYYTIQSSLEVSLNYIRILRFLKNYRISSLALKF